MGLSVQYRCLHRSQPLRAVRNAEVHAAEDEVAKHFKRTTAFLEDRSVRRPTLWNFDRDTTTTDRDAAWGLSTTSRLCTLA
jgi:hypothetical protein